MTRLHSPWPLFGDDLEGQVLAPPTVAGLVSTRTGHPVPSLGLGDALLDALRKGTIWRTPMRCTNGTFVSSATWGGQSLPLFAA